MASDETRDEVTGRPVQAVQDIASLVGQWLRRVWLQRTRAEWAVAWYLPLLTAAAALVVALASSVPMWLVQPRVDPAERAIPVGRHLLSILLDAPWRGVFLGLGLVVLDRVAGRWRRPLRWAVAGALFPALLAYRVPVPTSWADLPDLVRGGGLSWALGLDMPTWEGVLWMLAGSAAAAAWGWWVGRAVSETTLPRRALAQAGMEAGIVTSLASALLTLPLWWPYAAAAGAEWRALWGTQAFGLVAAALKGALNGLAIAIALWAGRPKAEAAGAMAQ